jgi:hypothetical protein
MKVTSNTGRPVKLKRPLDWMAITDHSDGMGTISEVIARNPEMMADPVVRGGRMPCAAATNTACTMRRWT